MRCKIPLILFALLLLGFTLNRATHDLDAAPPKDAKHTQTGKKAPPNDPEFAQYGIYAKTAPRPERTTARETRLPLQLKAGDRIALVGNTLLERDQNFGYIESMLHHRFPKHELVIRNLCWPADTPDIQPRPANYADMDQHLTHEKADVILAAFGFNESFDGQAGLEAFRQSLTNFAKEVTTQAYNGEAAPQVILLSPIANEDVANVPANKNNPNIELYANVVRDVAAQNGVGFVDLYQPTMQAMNESADDLTTNGVHLNKAGYAKLAKILHQGLFNETTSDAPDERLRQLVVDKSQQYVRRYRPLNTFYYTGDRNKSYGYLDFLPAMRNFDMMVANRERLIWDRAQGKSIPGRY